MGHDSHSQKGLPIARTTLLGHVMLLGLQLVFFNTYKHSLCAPLRLDREGSRPGPWSAQTSAGKYPALMKRRKAESLPPCPVTQSTLQEPVRRFSIVLFERRREEGQTETYSAVSSLHPYRSLLRFPALFQFMSAPSSLFSFTRDRTALCSLFWCMCWGGFAMYRRPNFLTGLVVLQTTVNSSRRLALCQLHHRRISRNCTMQTLPESSRCQGARSNGGSPATSTATRGQKRFCPFTRPFRSGTSQR